MPKRPLFDAFMKTAKDAWEKAKQEDAQSNNQEAKDELKGSIFAAVVDETFHSLNSLQKALEDFDPKKNSSNAQDENLLNSVQMVYNNFVENALIVGLISEDEKVNFNFDHIYQNDSNKIEQEIDNLFEKQQNNIQTLSGKIGPTNTTHVEDKILEVQFLKDKLEAQRSGFEELKRMNNQINSLVDPSKKGSSFFGICAFIAKGAAKIVEKTGSRYAEFVRHGYQAGRVKQFKDESENYYDLKKSTIGDAVAIPVIGPLILMAAPIVGTGIALLAGIPVALGTGLVNGVLEMRKSPAEQTRSQMLEEVKIAQKELGKNVPSNNDDRSSLSTSSSGKSFSGKSFN